MMKFCIALGALLVGFSASYYFVFALPNIQKQRLTEQTNAALWQREQECSTRAEHFFNESSWSEKGNTSYESHFNHRLNRCFISVRSNTFEATSIFYYKVLADVNDVKTIGEYDKQVMHGVADYTVKPFVCSMLEKYCTTDDEFDAFVKTYMED